MLMSEKLEPSPAQDPAQKASASSDSSPDAARREVLKRLGVYGAFVAPALLTVFSSSAKAQVIVDSGATN
jgi:hypothetical protein